MAMPDRAHERTPEKTPEKPPADVLPHAAPVPLNHAESLGVDQPSPLLMPAGAPSRPVPDPRNYMEGCIEMRYAGSGSYRRWWFLANNGLLMYFESEKSADCDGIVDLDNCDIDHVTGSREFRIGHPSHKPIVLLVTDPDDDPKDKRKPDDDRADLASSDQQQAAISTIELRAESADEAAEWVAVLRRGVDVLEVAEPFVLPRHISMEGQEEKCHWFNAFMGHYFQDILHSETVKFVFRKILQKKFDNIKKPESLGTIEIDDLSLGNEPISVKEVCIQPTDTANELQGEAAVVYRGGFWITIKTEFYVNFPRYRFATVPVSARVSLDFLQGRISLYGPPNLFSRMSLSFLEMPKCDFDISLNLGAKQYDVAKLSIVSDFIVSTLKKIIWKNLVMPNRLSFALPLPGHKLNAKTVQLTSRHKHQRK
eukprot:TRINITY_DN2952_c0_g1_i10.p1 TRINITY_DN2952_c0_g1~~TRINITY_DN2952_c0_g1_i10.p1  ORF type:complete len:425 (+),score=75.79 TRINITY_DN2952_c0_g1_i10:1087-2361(+)